MLYNLRLHLQLVDPLLLGQDHLLEVARFHAHLLYLFLIVEPIGHFEVRQDMLLAFNS